MTRAVDRQFEHENIQTRQRVTDSQAEDAGLLDPDQPTQTSHAEWEVQAFRPIGAEELTPLQWAMLRREYGLLSD